MKGNFNNIAPYYDQLSKIVFGDAIVNSQLYLLNFINAKSTILIVGGGTGWILNEISKKYPTGLEITYIEISEKMIELSKKRDFGKNKVIFINESMQEAVLYQEFDVVITPFVLDNFSNETTKEIFKKIDNKLKSSGKWLFSDFQLSAKHSLWQKPLLRLMYFFFRVMCNIEASSLPETSSLFDGSDYKKISSKTFFHDFICSSFYQKQKG